MNETIETTEETAVSRKRKITATVISTTVVVVMGIGLNVLADKVGKKVHDKIAKEDTEDE